MKKKEFKSSSKRLLDLMINSIYTNKEIFLRELLSNASDALDKLNFLSLTDASIEKDNLEIFIIPNKNERTLTIYDNGIGMSEEELEHNLGTIAESGSLKFKEENKDQKLLGNLESDFILPLWLLRRLKYYLEDMVARTLICGKVQVPTDIV